MPTYEYRCGACAHSFEEFQSITAEPFQVCPQCGKPALKRVLGTGAGMIFKGSGFYLTDYKKKDSASPRKDTPKKSGGKKAPGPEGSAPSAPKGDDKS